MQYISSLLLILFVGIVQCEEVKFLECDGSSANKQCTIHRVVVKPCPEAANNTACVLKKKSNATIEVQLTTIANINGLSTQAYWDSETGNLPLLGMDTVACKYMQCPTTGEKQDFIYNLPIDKKYPSMRYLVKWKIWKDNEVNCCFKFRIKIEKKTNVLGG